MSARSPAGYLPIAQSINERDEEEDDVGESNQASSSRPITKTRGLRRSGRPGSIDLTKLDTAFKRQVYIVPPLIYPLITYEVGPSRLHRK